MSLADELLADLEEVDAEDDHWVCLRVILFLSLTLFLRMSSQRLATLKMDRRF